MANTDKLALPLLSASQAQKHVTHNEALRLLDGIVQLSVLDRDLTAPPSSPTNGNRYIVASGATGAWAGWDLDIAFWTNGAWLRLSRQTGWRAWVEDEGLLLIYNGTAWVDNTPDDLNVQTLGINASADTTNRLAVSAAATLLNNAGAGHQLKINKATVGDTASLLYQTGFSGRAEMGLAGDDDWSIKVSPNGSAWTEALKVAAATGLVTGAAVQSSPLDTTTGRLLKVGAFGLGVIAAAQVLNDLDALDTPSGVYRTTNGTQNINNRPTGTNEFGYLRIERYDASAFTQYFTSVLPNNNINTSTFYRKYRAASSPQWSSWRLVYDNNNLLGTVSQVGGVPTGAVIESGINANGGYVRWADGTQVCTRTANASLAIDVAFMGGFRSAAQTWTYPAAFASAPKLNITPQDLTAFGGVSANAPGTSSAQWAVTSVLTQTAATRNVALIAVGRWF